jgi:hypothetical protein
MAEVTSQRFRNRYGCPRNCRNDRGDVAIRSKNRRDIFDRIRSMFFAVLEFVNFPPIKSNPSFFNTPEHRLFFSILDGCWYGFILGGLGSVENPAGDWLIFA